jgi:hypothetical protein
LRNLRGLKRAADNEIPQLLHEDKLRKLGEARDVAQAREKAVLATTTLAEAVTNEQLDTMEPEEALRVLNEYEEHSRKMVKTERGRIQARIREAAKEKAKAKACAKGTAKEKAKAKAKAKGIRRGGFSNR